MSNQIQIKGDFQFAPQAALCAADVPKLLPPDWDSKAAADKVLASLIKVTAPQVKGAHGSKLTMIGDLAYVATLADNTASGETHDRDSIYSALSVVNLRTMSVEKFMTTARSGQAFTNETLLRGACYASGTLPLNEHTLRCFFCSEQPGRGQSQMYYRDFDLRTRAFAEDVHRLKLKTSSGVFDLQPQHLHADATRHGFSKPAKDHALELLDAFKKFDGRTYAVLNSYVNALNALTVFNDAGDTLEVVANYNEPFELNLTESAVNRLPDGTWMAICRQEGGTRNYLFTTSRDGRTWTKAEPRDWVPNGTSSKPTFDKFGGVYYLGWQEATRVENVHRSVFNVDVSTDCVTWERKYRFESTQTFQYPAFAEHDGAVWLTVTQGRGADRIMFGKLENLSKPATKVTQQFLNSIHVTPKLILDPFPAYAQKFLPFAMASSMEVTRDGRLWTCWAGGQDGPNAYLLASYSDDQGKSWRDPVFVIDPQAHGLKMGTRLGCFWLDPKGRLWLFFHQSLGMFDGSCSNWFMRCDEPDAENPQWTKPVYIGFGASLNKPIVRQNGEWILPVSLWERWHIDPPYADCYRHLDAVRGADVFVSDDEGGHWRYRGGLIFNDSCFNEHSVAEKKDGTLWMLSRCMNEIAQSFSTDGGRTWAPQSTFFPHVNSKAVFRRLQSGNLLLVKHGREMATVTTDRRELTAFLSTDDGKSWSGGLLLDERPGVSYPDIAQAPNGDIYVHYDRNRTTDAEILFARFREEDVLERQLTTDGAALKNLVKSKAGMNRGGAMNAPQVVLTACTLGQTWAGIPGIEVTPGGRLYVSCFSGGDTEPHPENTAYLTTSDDGGRSFAAPVAMALPYSGTRVYDPTLWIDPLGRLWLIFNRGNKDTAEHGVFARICAEPDAPVPVWGEEFRVGYAAPFSFRMNKPTVLSTGEWLMPVTHAAQPVHDWFAGPAQRQGVGISRDQGRTWTLHGAVEAPNWALENMIMERRDGTLVMYIRTGAGVIWQSLSADRGLTWSAGEPTTIANPGSRFFIRALPDGDWLLINSPDPTRRTGIAACLSSDEGATWHGQLLLDERDFVTYPDAAFAADGTIYAVHDRERRPVGEILVSVFRKEDVMETQALLPSDWNPKQAGDRVLARLIRVTAPQVKGAHDAEFVCVGDRAYIVEHDNDIEPGHVANAAQYCVLSVVNLKTLAVEKVIPLAESEQAFDNVTLPKGMCFVPRIIRTGESSLRCYFCSQPDFGSPPDAEQALTWYRDFDLRTQTFAESIHKAKLKTAAGTFDMAPRHFHADAVTHGFSKPPKSLGLYIFDSFKRFDGRIYAALNNFETRQNALALLHDDFATFEVLGHYNEPQTQQLSESAVNRLPDGIWMAICRNETGNYHFTTSPDGRNWSVARELPFVANGDTSKPTFDRFGDLYYLGWQERTRVGDCGRSVFNLDISADGKTWQRKYRFESANAFQYPTFHEHDGAIWLTVTQSDHGGSSDRIMFGRLD